MDFHEIIYKRFKKFLNVELSTDLMKIDITSEKDFYDICNKIMMDLLAFPDIKLLSQSLEIKHIDYSKYIFLSYTPLSETEIEFRLLYKPENELKEMKILLNKKEN